MSGKREAQTQKSGIPRSRDRLLAVLAGAVALLVVAVGVLAYLVIRDSGDRDPVANAPALSELVAELMLLPDEEPSVATVTAAQALSSEPFFRRAEVGDKVLIFAGEEVAVIYRPESHIIVNAGPLVLNAPAAAKKNAKQ